MFMVVGCLLYLHPPEIGSKCTVKRLCEVLIALPDPQELPDMLRICANGEEELYDCEVDPLEWDNLADDPTYAWIKASLKSQLIALRDGPNWRLLNDLDAYAQDQRKERGRES